LTVEANKLNLFMSGTKEYRHAFMGGK
jgi:hypothetical protein